MQVKKVTVPCKCSYGRVSRQKLRAQLLLDCDKAGVKFLAGEVSSISCDDGAPASKLTLSDGTVLQSRLSFSRLQCITTWLSQALGPTRIAVFHG